MDKWEQLHTILKKLEWETDLKYDCLIQVLDHELGKEKRMELYQKAVERYDFLTLFEPPKK